MSAKKKVKSMGAKKATLKAKAEKKSHSSDLQKTKTQLVDELKKLRLMNTKLRRNEDKRMVAESEMSLVYDVISDYITAVDTNYRILSYNKAVEKQFGKGLKGKVCYEAYQARKEVCPDCAIKKAIETKKTAFTYQPATAISKPVEIYAYPMLDEKGNVVAVIEHGRDISEKLEMQQIYSVLIENANDAIMLFDAETGTVLEANRKAEEMLGRLRSEIIDMHQSELHPRGEREHYKEIFRKHIEKSGNIQPELLYVCRKDGSRMPVEVSPTVYQLGGKKLVLSIFRDVTEREKIENALKDSEEMFRRIFEKSPIGIEIYDSEGWLFAANRSSLNIFGVSRTEDLRRFNFIRDSYISDEAKNRLRDDETVRYRAAFDFDDAKKRGILETEKTGVVFLDVLITPLKGMRTGISGGYLFQVQDVTDQERSAEALIESEEKFRTLADKSPNMIFINKGGRIIYVNDKCEEIIGYGKEHFYSPDFNFLSLIAPEHIDLVKVRYKEHIEGKEVASYEYTLIDREGRKIDAIIATKMINYEGEQAILGIVTDVTEMKKMQEELLLYQKHLQDVVDERTTELKETADSLELEISERKKVEEELLRAQKLESVGILAGGIAHDFNNALTAILNNIYIVKMSLSKEEKVFSRIEAAEAAIQKAQGLTSKLLTFSMGGAPIKKKCNIASLLKENADFSLRGSNVKSEFEIAEDLWPVEADEGQLSQVVSSLVINADHAMPEGGTVVVSAVNVLLAEKDVSMLEEGRYVKLSIKDSGIGIPTALLPKIFDPYFTTKQKGSGLGLATAYSIVRKHDGQITVETGEGGTTFHVYLPALEDVTVHEKQDEIDLTVERGNVLLMDDEALIAQSVVVGLEEFGFRAEYVLDGESAIESYRRARESGTPFDAVVLDLTIPGAMGGKDAINKLREIDPDVKAIVASGYSNDPVMSSFREYGFISVLPKPYNIEGLVRELKKII